MKTLGFVYLISVSAILGMTGLVIFYRRLTLYVTGVRATGNFVRWEIRGLNKKYFYPVVSFEAQDGKKYEFTGGPGNTKQESKDFYSILYPVRNPEKAMILSFLAFWAAPFAFFILSAGAAFAAFHR